MQTAWFYLKTKDEKKKTRVVLFEQCSQNQR